ncbi:hypothetical protein [Hymenobacter ruricola]|uniref:Secreted protein n=1 Tax=Hymenobacter ruricola TaxID=2791023 RepID=A0ABS0I0J3_9BACT|nr:hypothetical protein [Hymenobacter ruricola]MBF9220460.1 hypothetical protein [Hymenobacter ruricola]
MSKFAHFLFALLLVVSSFSAHAQMSDRLSEHPTYGKALAKDAENVTREMANRLHLNEGQVLRLLPLNRTKLAGLNSINREYKTDEAARAAKAAELEAQYEQECSRILTPSQLSQLQQTNGQPSTAPATTGNGLG